MTYQIRTCWFTIRQHYYSYSVEVDELLNCSSCGLCVLKFSLSASEIDIYIFRTFTVFNFLCLANNTWVSFDLSRGNIINILQSRMISSICSIQRMKKGDVENWEFNQNGSGTKKSEKKYQMIRQYYFYFNSMMHGH